MGVSGKARSVLDVALSGVRGSAAVRSTQPTQLWYVVWSGRS